MYSKSKMIIDLRSDTVTKPTEAMLQTMMEAVVGDDVFGEDPTVNELEEKAARMFGKEAALFCPSGTMANQIAIKIHTVPGDEVICDKLSHIYNYEGGGIAFNSGASVRLIHGDRGRFTANDVLKNINPEDVHFPTTKLVSVENTVNRGGGCYYRYQELIGISEVCMQKELKFHLDGARLFNAIVETADDIEDTGRLFDTVSVCLSKGLGAPAGSVLIGNTNEIYKARRIRKVFGGAMRQAGYIAAAGIYALDNHINRLIDDHRRAKELEEVLNALPYIENVFPVDTNIVVFKLEEYMTTEEFLHELSKHHIKAVPFGVQTVRMVTHLDFDDDMLQAVIEALQKIK